MKRVLVIGDSWGAGHVAESQTDEGWPLMMGIPAELRQAVDGTTAAQWAADLNGMLSRALATPCDVVIVSLAGNDAFAAYADKCVTPEEVTAAVTALETVAAAMVAKHRDVRLLLYANPYPKDWRAMLAVGAMNGLITGAGERAGATTLPTGGTLASPDCFACGDFHPSWEGHRRLAKHISATIEEGKK